MRIRKTRRPKTSRVERTRADGTWTESSFWQFIRSGLRLMSKRWPPLYTCLKQARRPYYGYNKKQKWEYQCASCSKWFGRKLVQVDHLNECGTLKSYDDAALFIERLFCETDELQIMCIPCHNRKTHK